MTILLVRHGRYLPKDQDSKGDSDKWLFLEDFQIYQENWILENDRSPGGLGNSKDLIFQKSAKEDKNMHFSEVPKEGLSLKGTKQIEELRAKIQNKGIHYEHIFTSSKTRAKQTAAILAAGQKVEILDELLPATEPAVLYEKIQSLPNNSLLVGHNPLLSSLSLYFDFPHQFETADCLVIEDPEKKYLV